MDQEKIFHPPQKFAYESPLCREVQSPSVLVLWSGSFGRRIKGVKLVGRVT